MSEKYGPPESPVEYTTVDPTGRTVRPSRVTRVPGGLVVRALPVDPRSHLSSDVVPDYTSGV